LNDLLIQQGHNGHDADLTRCLPTTQSGHPLRP
jgi:hypothetical protein